MKTRQLRVVHVMIVRIKSSTQVHCKSIVQGFMSDYRRWNKDGEGFNDRDLRIQEFSGQDGEEGLPENQVRKDHLTARISVTMIYKILVPTMSII